MAVRDAAKIWDRLYPPNPDETVQETEVQEEPPRELPFAERMKRLVELGSAKPKRKPQQAATDTTLVGFLYNYGCSNILS